MAQVNCDELRTILSGKALGFRYGEVARWLRRADFEPPRKPEGSHRVWVHPPSGRRVPLVDKGRGQLLPCYVKAAARTLWEIAGCAD